MFKTERNASYEKSLEMFSRAKKSLAGGVSSSARIPPAGTVPVYIDRGNGSHVWDIDGNEYIDCLLSYGTLIAGHIHSSVISAIEKQISKGFMFGTCNVPEVELAELICRLVPCAELVRYSNSGSEAISGAIRAARGFTGKNKILKFEGHYHGWTDVLAVSQRPGLSEAGDFSSPQSLPHSKGIPAGVVEDVVICPWNEPEIFKAILDKNGNDIAAVIAEPIVANNGCIMPQKDYLELLREECSKRKIVLIFDEIVTGFRAAPGGAQQYYNVIPDIAVFSKAIGGGMPISAFAGKRNIIEPIAENTVKHGGTYNGNPLSSVSAIETLRLIENPEVINSVHQRGRKIMDTIKRAAADNNIKCYVQGLGSMFQVLFTEKEKVTNYRDLFEVDTKKFAAFREALFKRGILINTSFSACWFLSIAHTDDDITMVCDAVESSMKDIK
ncbi:MAG TPA: glutamate-1-semialdehyde 2,1-aminomutase [Spirochaetota bacterium]|nr:glutamate-1-semialdehyde 2,1-aminomutase [Spirochaetota bacterium]HOR44697.1 glutamate-1-semialdehyde 2,1-aminomutase [Spirochaetota bacterium]HPK56496.1 glutamate-1-semialdehyde 2,1-aminomutase [Spirochaetota bacterium]HPK56508.1 glutamate-1-semialdehyde 2,1-aminomutase [Spirochaetota bacterium]